MNTLTQTASSHGPAPRVYASCFTGLSWNKRIAKWEASITVQGKPRYLGSFDDEIVAARAYDQTARGAFGEFANLNFPNAADRQRAAAWIGRHEARRRFGVSLKTWERWEREGLIQCGKRVGGGPKLYRIQDIDRLLQEFGRMAPPYADPDRPCCYRVPLSGYDIHRREAIIDAESLPLVEGRQWCWSKGRNGGKGMVVQARQGAATPLRRIIMGITDPDMEVGHVNGNSLDCRRDNLRVRRVVERVWGTRKRKTHHGKPCTSQFKGVSWNSQNNRWRAQIHTEGTTHHLGTFYNEIEAAEAYDEAARKFFGEHAWLNFPDDGSRDFVDATLSRVAA